MEVAVDDLSTWTGHPPTPGPSHPHPLNPPPLPLALLSILKALTTDVTAANALQDRIDFNLSFYTDFNIHRLLRVTMQKTPETPELTVVA